MLGLRPSATRARDVRAALHRVDPSVLRSRLDQIGTLDVCDELADLRLPLLYLRPTRDRLVPRSALARMQRVHPDLQVQTFPGPHLLAQARPQAVADATRAFIRTTG